MRGDEWGVLVFLALALAFVSGLGFGTAPDFRPGYAIGACCGLASGFTALCAWRAFRTRGGDR